MPKLHILDPEQNTQRIFGRQGFCEVTEVEGRPGWFLHGGSGLVYAAAELSAAWAESRNARPVMYAGRDAGIAWPRND